MFYLGKTVLQEYRNVGTERVALRHPKCSSLIGWMSCLIDDQRD
jgi:hypothetical protein